MNSPIENPSAYSKEQVEKRILEHREKVVRPEMAVREGLSQNIDELRKQQAIGTVDNPDRIRALKIDKWNGFIDNIRTNVHPVYAEKLKANLPVLLKNLPDGVSEEVTTMTESFLELPDLDSTTNIRHRYFSSRRINEKGTDPWYSLDVNWKQVDSDEKLLEDLKKTNPKCAEELTTLQNAIEELSRQSVDWGEHEWQRRQKLHPDKLDKAVLKTGRMGLFLAASAAAILTGVMAIFNKKFSAAPFLYAGVALCLANPDLLKALFRGKARNLIENTKPILNDNFRNLAREHGIGGSEWSQFAEDVMQKDSSTQEAVERTLAFCKQNGNNIAHASDTDLEVLTKKLVPGENEKKQAVRAELVKIIREGTFPMLISSLRASGNKDAQNLALDYITGSPSAFEEDARAVKAAEEAASKAPEAATEEGATESTATDSPFS